MFGRIFTILAVLAWSFLVFTDYVVQHTYVIETLQAIPCPGLVAFVGLTAGLAGLWAHLQRRRSDDQQAALPFRGLTAYLAVQVFSAVVIITFSSGGFLSGSSPVARAGYFFGYSSIHLAGLILIVTAAYSLGSWLTSSLREKLGEGNTLVNIAFGFSLLGIPLVLLGLGDVLNVYTCWGLLLLAIGLRWRATLSFLTDLLWTKQYVTFSRWWSPAILVVLLAVTGFNVTAAFKTFPIGYDGSALYVNLANLMADTGGLPYGGQAYGWSLMMAFGQTLFGSLSVAMLISHLMNVLCALMVYRLARLWLSQDYALLAAFIPLVSPYFGFHSIVDEKIDLAFAFIILAGVYVAARTLVQSKPSGESLTVSIPFINKSLSPTAFSFLLLGWLAGYAFTVKYTAIVYVLAITVWLFQKYGGRWAYLSALSVALGFVFLSGIYRFGYLDLTGAQSALLGAGLTISGLTGLWFTYRNELRTVLQPVMLTGLMALSFLTAFSPWAIKHVAENGNVSVSSLIRGRAKKPPLEFIPKLSHRTSSDRVLPRLISNRELTSAARPRLVGQQQKKDNRPGRDATDGAVREEIQRYLGYEQYFWRYASLPNDLNAGVNIPNQRYVDPGFLFLLFFPLLLFAVGRQRPPVWRGVLYACSVLVVLAGSYYAIYASAAGDFAADSAWQELQNKLVANDIPSWMAGLHALFVRPIFMLAGVLSPVFFLLGDLTLWATLLVMFGVFALAALRVRHRFADDTSGIKGFAGFLAVYSLLWWLLGNGVIWYALPLFVATPIVWLWFLESPGRLLGADLRNFSRYFGGAVLSVFVLLYTLHYFTSQYPGEPNTASILRSPFVEVITDPTRPARKAVDKFNPKVSEAIRIMNADPSTNIYRVNTHYGFLISKNSTRVFSDPTLERYDQITARLDDNSKFFDMLKAQGFRYIFFDLRTATVDRTPEQTLKKKFISIARELTSSPKVRILVTDNYVEDPAAPLIRLPNGQQANARYGVHGQTIYPGNIALFEIL
ncbi:glycosyltransferase family 39 protein [Neolewinella aurantiaca]|uniref:Glycosyltransferase family 39 protein n=1 Tax=Neolewinella aurantiaca TaxID=2602767 RepID=A0A5C7F434_9BACT|nr:glycosyltransferase family 39 protein [Neolewinella aurantiaca]TXF85451.1 glycosyltransferase family 39 protein [Neolewinella aurantiaca]